MHCASNLRESFDAEMRLGNLGCINFVRMICGRSFIDRTLRQAEHASGRAFTFLLQAHGAGVFSHYGHEARLTQGDFVLCDSAAPHSYRVEESAEVVMLRVPANLLKEHLPSPECFCGRRLEATEGLTSTVAALTLSLCEELEAGLPLDFHARVAHSLLEMIATSYAAAFASLIMTSSIVSGRHANVKLFIEQHLRDPELSPATIASRLKLSSRYLRMVFAVGNETVSAYILRRRLEECARQMSDPRWRGHSISEIAFSWGFNSAPHFTRSFRERYKISPRDYRRLSSHSTSSGRPDPHGLDVDQLSHAGGAELAAVAR
jgi:AraC-like DNA-binding protein